jgi:hypothetical protein
MEMAARGKLTSRYMWVSKQHSSSVPILDQVRCNEKSLFDHLVGPAEQREWERNTAEPADVTPILRY